MTPALAIGGDLVLESGTFAVGVNGSIDANGTNGIVVAAGATLDITGFQTLVPAPTPITIRAGGKLNIGAGGTLLLESNTLSVEAGGVLCLDGLAASRAGLAGHLGQRYNLALASGATLFAKGFLFRQMNASGIVIGPGVTLASAPYDLRGGIFDLPDANGVLLDIQRSVPTELRYLRFDNSQAASNVKNVRTSLASATLTFVNWSGDLASDASSAESSDDDPGEPSLDRIVWAPPEASDVQDFSARFGSDHVRVSWRTLSEIDSAGFLVQRSPDPPASFADLLTLPAVGASTYRMQDHAILPGSGYRYRLHEILTHGDTRLLGEQVLPASSAPEAFYPVWGRPAPPPPPLPIVIGPGGAHPDVPNAIRAFARGHHGEALVFVLAGGRHAGFAIGAELDFDLCLRAEPDAVVDATRTPVRIHDLAAGRALELVDLVIDGGLAPHAAVTVEHTKGLVLFQDVEVRRAWRGPAAVLADARAVAFQGGALEKTLALDHHSRATMIGTRLASFELRGGSMLETRSTQALALVEPGATHFARGPAPQLAIERRAVALAAEVEGFAWLGAAPRLAFCPLNSGVLEGVPLIDPRALVAVGPLRPLSAGRASWSLGALPQGTRLYLQAACLDLTTRRICISNVVRLDQ